MASKQSLPDGSIVIFHHKNLKENFEMPWINFDYLEGKSVRILGLGTYTELGQKDFEYYNIEFTDSFFELSAISGYHLETIKS